ncbi:CDGSH iron-sulfur domain-containing protein [Modestobacter roseus]|uniref:CDGSH-type Zn-finger protein n=1 Tax=Modestobacter roseus TaxID=1181884 RepID=A0A562IMM3_9ACTN|nr:CDGSH iron-sulfur domain-containing protein [Modestobacter roseus]TWH72267.1 CDGSH-type Zn-finger protein [Modestobacter roseus]
MSATDRGNGLPVQPDTAEPTDPADEISDDSVRDLGPAGEPTATITPYRDGPLVVRGDFRLVDTDGNEIDPGRKTVALCRCGKSGIKPFCDGTHKRSGFHAASAPARPRPAARIVAEAREDRG